MRATNLKKQARVILSLFIIIALVFSLGGCGIATENSSAPTVNESSTLVAEFWDVGQGDCSFYTLPDGKTLLIDAANRGDGEELVKHLKSKGITKLDYVIATHPHADHIGGISVVIDELEIGQIFAPKIAEKDIPTTKTYEEFLTSVQNKGLKITAAKHGTTLFEGEGYKADCLAPVNEECEGLNNYSVVVRLVHGEHTFLLTGDAEKVSEAEILDMGYAVDCDVLKVGHHGSSTSSSKEFLEAASPEIAVISCGRDNSYGHPHKETMSALNSLEGLEAILRTDEDRTIIITSDGKDSLTYTKDNPTVIED